jgi:hypothetical protein
MRVKGIVMKNKFNHIALATLTTLSIGGCLAEEPASDSEQASLGAAPETSSRAPTDLEIASQIQAAAAVNFHEIVNFAFGNQCVDAPGGVLNVVLRIAACNGSDTQKWSFVAASSPNTFFLVNKRSGFCAEVNNGTSNPGELVDEFHCDGSQAEQWVQSFRVVDGVSYQQYRHLGTSLCLDTVGGAGSQLMQFSCGSSNNAQTWLVR